MRREIRYCFLVTSVILLWVSDTSAETTLYFTTETWSDIREEISTAFESDSVVEARFGGDLYIVDDFSGEHVSAFLEFDGTLTLRPDNPNAGRVLFTPSQEWTSLGRLAWVGGSSTLVAVAIDAAGFGSGTGSGGTIKVTDEASLFLVNSVIRDGFAGSRGGALHISGQSRFLVLDSEFIGNSADLGGGAIQFDENVIGEVLRSVFSNSSADLDGCHIGARLSQRNSDLLPRDLWLGQNQFTGECETSFINITGGPVRLSGNTQSGRWEYSYQFDDSDLDLSEMDYSVVEGLPLFRKQQAEPDEKSKPESACSDSSSGNLLSLGYNITDDDSCGFNQATDLPSTDPQLLADSSGFMVPQAGSPAIDISPVEAIVRGSDELASLPCGYADVRGVGRPQDGDGDGVFGCDAGAVEVAGSGAISTGHSGAYFNSERDGEGTYVEILSDTLALVYTFTYRPDGSGPAWFIGVGQIIGNSIVIPDLLRPIGASFGDGFMSEDIEYSQLGGMSMVFPTCEALDQPGNVAYSGDASLAYEGLNTKALRLGNILGCGEETPSDRAGLSGSYYDPDRNGEGIIVQWLSSGQVLVVFFTFDRDGDQLWLLGIGTPEGDSVTMDALYAADVTSWGRAFDPDQVGIETWGTFTLDWAGRCNAVDFSYSSNVEGYGSAEHNYTSLSKLAGTSCPQ